MDISPGDSTPTSEISYSHSAPMQAASTETSMGPVLLATALPRLISHPHLPSTPNASNQPESSPLLNPQSTPSMVPPPACVTTSNAPGPPLGTHLSQISNQTDVNDPKTLHTSILLPRQLSSSADNTQPLSVETNHSGPVIEGPPTPTHSETLDCAKGMF